MIFFNEQILPDGLNYFQIGCGDDDEGKDKAKQVDVDNVKDRAAGRVRVMPCPDNTAAKQRIDFN